MPIVSCSGRIFTTEAIVSHYCSDSRYLISMVLILVPADELSVGKDSVDAAYFGLPTIATRNGYEISLANFTVAYGANKLTRTTDGVVGGGVAESGSLRSGVVTGNNITNDTATGQYFVSSYNLDTA